MMMIERPSIPEQMQPLDYFRPRQRRPSTGILLTSIAFAAGHWCVELVMQYLFFFQFAGFGTWSVPVRRMRRMDGFVDSMVIETVLIVMALGLVFAVQWLLRPRLLAHKLKPLWVLAVVLGLSYCWLRWGISWMSKTVPFSYPGPLDLLVAMGLALVSGFVLATRRRAMAPGNS